MTKRIWAVILLVITAWMGLYSMCYSPRYYTYKMGATLDNITYTKIIPVWTDSSFTDDELRSIKGALNEWNFVLNNQLILKYEGVFKGEKGADEKVKIVEKTDLGWIIMRLSSEDPLVGLTGKNSLAFAEMGGNLMVVVYDRIGTRNLRVIAMHEMAHLLGSAHVHLPNLMYPAYGANQYPCIDKITAAQVATMQKIKFESMNYCITPQFE